MADIDADLEYILRRHPVATMAALETLNGDEIQDGYRDGFEGLTCGDNRSRSYWHGWRNGMMDKNRIKSDWASQSLAREYIESNNRPKWNAAR